MLYGQDRRALREVFFAAWRKHQAGEPLTGVEPLIVAVVRRHPEYQELLEQPEASADRDWLPELGESNPFLHMAMHLAIEEQLTIDQPAGLRGHYAALTRRLGDEHAAQHLVMECLGEMLWHAGRSGTAPDAQRYLDCLARTSGLPPATR
jgi:Domain of unknown function (DUF1841)